MNGEVRTTLNPTSKTPTTPNPETKPSSKPEFNIKQPDGCFMASRVNEKDKQEPNPKPDSAFKAAVGMSRKWGAWEAGWEVLDDLKQM